MSGIDHVRELFKLARADLKAMTGMQDPTLFTDAIFGFHAQQAVEKGLKAWIAAMDVLYPLTHDISRLVAQLAAQGVETGDLWEWVELTPFAVEHRYTWGNDQEAPLDRMNLINRITSLLDFIESRIPILSSQ
ncbi:MAG: HEPN domain-containing protein [Magnetococcales bacterium]|nr:HEPN domain-containing protein [Magnetococcales bacterium]